MSHPMTTCEKMLARCAGKDAVRAGDFIYPDPELVIVHDGYVETAAKELSEIGYRRITHPERVVFVTDHDVLYTSPRAAERGIANRRIARDWRVGRFYDAGQGGHGHIFPMEHGLVRAGMVLMAYDIHCTNFGALGALALGVGTEITAVLATGSVLTEVPRTIRVTLKGRLRPGVHARDIGFLLANELATGKRAVAYEGRVIEFAGAEIDAMPLAARVALCNTLTEIGVGNMLFPAIDLHGNRVLPELASDLGAVFESELTVDLNAMTPQVALPGAPENAVDITQVLGQPIQHAYIGSCGSGMYEDFAAAAALMRGQHVAPGVRLILVPGTTKVAQRLAEEGLLNQFTEAGAILLPPGCGPCAGGRSSLLGPDEVSISTAATNHTGRMGATSAQCFLGSPLTVAASAIAGCITDPRALITTGVEHA
jgi:3-isopropylmalate/(R)-2-methylmalate dehydratase large subunit